MIGLFLGRFQPFHNGHLHVVMQALQECEKLKLVIGSTQKKDENNPYSADEREAMIDASLREAGVRGGVEIYRVPDIPVDEEYVDHVERIVGDFDTVYVIENELNKRLFSDADYPVVVQQKFQGIDATEIRRRIREGERWQHLVPAPVAKFLEE